MYNVLAAINTLTVIEIKVSDAGGQKGLLPMKAPEVKLSLERAILCRLEELRDD